MIKGVDHIGIAVRSIDEARGFYEAIGLEISAIEEVPQEGVRVAMIPCGASRIELLEPLGDDSPISKFLDRRGPGMHHLCLRTDDVHEDDSSLRAAGLELLREQPGTGAEGAAVQFVHPASSGGVLLELSEPASTVVASRPVPRVMESGSVVILHLANPSEKFWGVMEDLSQTGVTLRGLNLGIFEDWVAQAASDEDPSLGLATMFVPLFRVERMFLDHQVGEVESYQQRFERRVGVPVRSFLSAGDSPQN